jgi:hypothetical protein
MLGRLFSLRWVCGFALQFACSPQSGGDAGQTDSGQQLCVIGYSLVGYGFGITQPVLTPRVVHELDADEVIGPVRFGCNPQPSLTRYDADLFPNGTDGGNGNASYDSVNRRLRVSAPTSGNYVLSNSTQDLYFAEAPLRPPLQFAAKCRNIFQLDEGLWACGSLLLHSDGGLTRTSEFAWRKSGEKLIGLSDSGVRLFSSIQDQNPLAWANAPRGDYQYLSANDSGISIFEGDAFWSCDKGQSECRVLGALDAGRFGAYSGTVFGLHRVDGRTLVYGPDSRAVFCDIDELKCKHEAGALIAARGQRLFARGLFFTAARYATVSPIDISGNTSSDVREGFYGPSRFDITKYPGYLPERPLLGNDDDGRYLVVNWGSQSRLLEVFHEPTATTVGAGEDFFWASDYDAGVTRLYLR